jgi:hypothetical protein
MNLACPTCGAEVSFRFDDSLVRICAHCKSAVARTDRGVESLGQFGDPARINSPLRLFADGNWGPQSFMVIGKSQLLHDGGGLWQEWYAKFGAGVWGWLTEAQGRLYMTFERPDITVPPWDQLSPEAEMTIDGKSFTVNERGTAVYVSAMGEIPYRLVPQSDFFFVDLSDGEGGFATIDFNDGSQTPTIYVGQQTSAEQLKITGGEAAREALPVGEALKCPDCGGALQIRQPDTLSIACPYCGDLIDVSSGRLSVIAQQKRKRATPEIALGTQGLFSEGAFTVIAYLARSAYVDGVWYPFEEYLLHSPKIGFRWLANHDNHWSYVQPIATGAVEMKGGKASYDGVKFTPFQQSALRVDYVIGELYWRVEVGEIVEAIDLIAPPAMLSRQSSTNEVNWSLSSYLSHADVKKAFGKRPLSSPIGIAANQPYPPGVGLVMSMFTAALLTVGVVKCSRASDTVVHTETINIPSGPAPQPSATPPVPATPVSKEGGLAGVPPNHDEISPPPPAPPPPADPAAAPAEPAGHVMFSKAFNLEDRNIEIETSASLLNNWAHVAIDLVNDKTGKFVSFDQSLESYSGIDDGESWSEGSSSASQVLGPMGEGEYVLRIEAQQGATTGVTSTIRIRQAVFRARWMFLALGILCIPFGIVLWHAHSFRKRRLKHSNIAAGAWVE